MRGELIRGVLCKKMGSGEEHGEIAGLLYHFLMSFVRPKQLGRLVLTDVGTRLERDPDTVREPDIAFISAEKRPRGIRNTGYVEVVSPNDHLVEVNDKARMWLNYGVSLVWVVDPDSRAVEVHPIDGPVVRLGEDDILDGGGVLTGFACRVGRHINANHRRNELKLGLFLMPLHYPERLHADTFQEDLELMEYADGLGYSE